ncbi:MAG: hypothetical protein RI907_1833 [Pseudomonadota bacterium]|jgi:acyl-CoA thioesterase
MLFLPDMSEANLTAAQPELVSLPQLLAMRRQEGHLVHFTVTPDWGQGRTTFGGLLSTLAVQAMRDVCGSDWPLRALQTNFVGPVAAGTFEVDVCLLRQGKNVRQVQARITQNAPDGTPQVAGVMVGVFGLGRPSAIPLLMPAPPDVTTDAERAFLWPYIPGVTPDFTRHMEVRHAQGVTPFTGATEWYSRSFARLRQHADVDAELTTVLLADVGPTPALATLSKPAAASSVSWSLELRPVLGDPGDGLWRMDKTALAAAEGYVNEKTELWAPDGQLAALGYQVVAVYG